MSASRSGVGWCFSSEKTPLHAGHIKSMLAVSEMGGIIAPPVPAFYAKPETTDDMVAHTVSRALDLFGLDTQTFPRWGEIPATDTQEAGQQMRLHQADKAVYLRTASRDA